VQAVGNDHCNLPGMRGVEMTGPKEQQFGYQIVMFDF
jgi:hypothetical protein